MNNSKNKTAKKKDLSKILSLQINELLPTDPKGQKALDEIFSHLLKTTKIDFSHYRDTTVLRRLYRRMSLNKKSTLEIYLDYLKTNPKELELLYADLLLSFTEFFREPHIFNTLKEKIFPQLAKDRTAKNPIRIWVAGCSTGEEVYSLAICLYEFLEKINSNASVQIFGTDLAEKNIMKARIGLYANKAVKKISKERLERFFEQTTDGIRVIKAIREMCVFGVQDITQDPPFSNIDLVSCRNVLIYFDDTFQETAIPLFHFSLKQNGYLLLGTSETMGKFPQYFNVYDQKLNLYTKRTTGAKPNYKFAFRQSFSKFNGTENTLFTKLAPQIPAIKIKEQINKILLDHYMPSGVLVDSSMQILHFVGHPFPFLSPTGGEASLKLSKMTGEGLMPDLYVAIEEVKKRNTKVQKKNISFKQNNKLITTNISVIPVSGGILDEISFLILFEEVNTLQTNKNTNNENSGEELNYLKHELQLTKEHLQLIIDEKDEVNQSLWAANEEVLSTNEELQIIKEEMETAKEELESGNEELISLNEELHTKNIESLEAKKFAENLLETANAIVVTLDKNADIVIFNKFAEELTGYKKNEIIGKNWFNLFIPKKYSNTIPEVFEKALKNMPEISNYENIILTKNNQEKTILWSNNIIKDSKNNISGVLTIGTDITVRKLALDALKESENKYRLLTENILGILYSTDEKGIITYISSQIEKQGFSPKSLISKNIIELIHPDDKERIQKTFIETFETRKEFSNTFRIFDTKGKIRWLDNKGRILYDKAGNISGISGLLHDITVRKLAVDELKKFQSIINESNSGIIIVDLTDKILYINDFFAEMHGYTVSELLDKNRKILYNSDQYVIATELIEDILKSGKISNKEIWHSKKDGSIFPVLMNEITVNDENSNPIMIAGSVIDITKQKKAEEKLLEMAKLKSVGTLAGGIAHDFNNILTGIYGNISLAQIGLSESSQSFKYLIKAEKSMSRAIKLTKQLLTFSKGGAPVKENANISKIVNEVITFDLSGSNIKAVFTQQDNLWNVEVDKGQIGQVFSNLTINANQAMPDGGHLYIDMRNIQISKGEITELKVGNYVKIVIRDEGIGIDKKYLNKIFDPYFTTKQTGNGLGLAITYSIIQKHNGSIEIDSEPGVGTTFSIYLPALKSQSIEKAEQSKVKLSIAKKPAKILIMDDDKAICTLVVEMIKIFGFSAEMTFDGKDAIEIYKKSVEEKNPFDVIIMDLTIPGGMGGKDAIKHILKINPNTKAIVSSGYSNNPIMSNYKAYGFKGIIEKPYTIENLEKVLDAVLE